ncbi:rhodanese domain-containing protein, partial [Rhodohalobacter sp. WB101]|nr:rhodanese domain-containing protein [Rhodohalobacter sulfatireducens]
MKYEVILYYNFEPIEDPETFCNEHKQKMKDLGVKGRVYIGQEGINGTLGGTPEQIQNYKEFLWSIEGFEDTQFKTDEDDTVPFAKLICKVRDELVAI